MESHCKHGNVLLRRQQYREADDDFAACQIARNMIFGKLYNSAHSIARTRRDHALRVDVEELLKAEETIKGLYTQARECTDTETRGLKYSILRSLQKLYFGRPPRGGVD